MRITWDDIGNRLYETGVSQGVLYPRAIGGTYPLGVPWNGLTAVNESPSGAEPNPIYADNIEYVNIQSAEKFAASVEAFTYPDEWAECDGSTEIAPGVTIGQQKRKVFGLSYKTLLGNDEDATDHGYKLHIVYGGQAAPSEKGYATVGETPEAITFSWEVSTTPVIVSGLKPTATLTIDSTKVDAAKLTALENILYGAEGADPRLPLPDEIAAIFEEDAPSALALSTIAPDDEDAAVAVGANIVLTFNNKILREAIVVASAAGEIVAGAKTWDTAGKVLTFNPDSNLASGTTYLVMVGGVVDIYNQTLAAVVKNFATA